LKKSEKPGAPTGVKLCFLMFMEFLGVLVPSLFISREIFFNPDYPGLPRIIPDYPGLGRMTVPK